MGALLTVVTAVLGLAGAPGPCSLGDGGCPRGLRAPSRIVTVCAASLPKAQRQHCDAVTPKGELPLDSPDCSLALGRCGKPPLQCLVTSRGCSDPGSAPDRVRPL